MTEMEATGRRRRFLFWVAAALVALAGWGVLAHWTPAGGAEHSICVFRRATGISCPGCGMTRAAALLAKGKLAEGFYMHPLAPVLAAEAGLAWAAWGLVALGRRSRPGRWLGARARAWVTPLLLAHVGVLLALWLARLATGTLPP